MKRAFNEAFLNLPSTSESSDREQSKFVNILFVCDEWNSSKGGLSTFNREFAINLAKASRDDFAIHCYVCQSSESDREDARNNGVNIITANNIPGISDRLEWLRLPPSELPHPDVVIGHGRKFGTPAYFIRQIKKCKWVQFVHVFCEDLGKYKQTDTNTQTDAVEENEKKHKQEINLCKAANAVVAVGSRLQQKYSRCLPDTKVHIITPGILDKFVSLSDQKLANISHSPDEFSVFVFGRGSYEDLPLKGYDIIANALGSLGVKFKMTFVGSPEGQHSNIMDWFVRNTSITRRQLTVRGYCNQDEVKEMFYAADLVAMPSRTEGFGLIALEAISAGVPVLLTSESGIAKVLEQVDGGNSVIVESEDLEEWSQKIRTLSEMKLKERLDTAMKLRESYNKAFPWDTQCDNFKEIILRMMSDSRCGETDEDKAGVPQAQVAVGASASATEQVVKKVAAKLGSGLSTGEHTAHQMQENGKLRPPKRPGYGTVGRPIKFRANFFRMNISPRLSDLYHYDVEITPSKCPCMVKRDVVNQIVMKYRSTLFEGHDPAFDGEKNLYSRIKFPTPAELDVTLPGKDGGKDRVFKVKIQFAAAVSIDSLKKFLMGQQNGNSAQDAVQALDTVMRQIPSKRFTPVGQSFFPLDGYGSKYLGEGCEVQFGFYQSIRPSQWKAMLVNIDVSVKGFFKSQGVIEFVGETLDLSPHQLEDPRCQIDRWKLEKAIRGLRVQTTHVASIKRKYTVWGVSSQSAERQEFDVEDETTGRRAKTNVAAYFRDRYHIRLRFPNLPCLQVGQKKDRYLPLEVCTIIPCQKRHLSEQQTANMIRSTARPAPERRQDIKYWAQELIRTSEKYLDKEFQTTVDPELVRVDGRVLPAPKINLGPQDQALVPRDGSWDMRDKALHQGAVINTWAMACFAPFQRCNENQLRNFCRQMATVSSREGMRMTDPVEVRYARNTEVQSLFSKWMVDYPGLQLIMAVLPNKDKDLYAEIKRVADNVLGVPTQCVQMKLVQQPKGQAQVCANLSLKINSKLGGINQVIDPSVQSPVLGKSTIVFGADVTHPSPTENGIPSIAAVVASMDPSATKYQARVRAQTHEKGRGAQEIINDLAVIVRELLIEFYKANGNCKPSRIIFFRDGVSKGQFGQVLVYEVRAIQEACMRLEKEYRPRITFIVVQKRHHTRLFCENSRDETKNKARSVPPGTTVDSGITHPYEFDFYLFSHFGIQGVSRPTHYHVLYDDNGLDADIIQQLTYQLCHVYARCTKSVSMPAPAYYAHLAAFHARVHVTNGGSSRDAGAVDLDKCSKAIQVSDKMKGVMYFT